MVRILSDFILRYRFKKQCKSLSLITKKDIKQFKNMIVLVPQKYEVDTQLFFKFSETFKIPSQKITIVVFNQNKLKTEDEKSSEIVYCSKDNLGFWGQKSQALTAVFQQDFDLLINYFDDKALLPSYVSAFCQAKVRLGFSNANHVLNDLILAINPNNPKLFLSESTKYLKTILKRV